MGENINKKLKKLVTLSMLSLVLAGTAVTQAHANTGVFAFLLKAGERKSSAGVKKTDSIQYAGVTTQYGDITSADEV